MCSQITCPHLLSDTGNTIVISITIKLKKKKRLCFNQALSTSEKKSIFLQGNTLQYYLNLTLSIAEKRENPSISVIERILKYTDLLAFIFSVF